MMTLGQLQEQIDTLRKTNSQTAHSARGYLASYLYPLSSPQADSIFRKYLTQAARQTPVSYKENFAERLPDSLRSGLVQTALGNMRNAQQLVDMTAVNERADKDRMIRFQVEWHRKFTMAAACILLFLIGAPMGAIIRKGGLGMPMLASIVLFLIWYILTFVGEKLVTSGSLPPWLGMWGSTILLTPLALFIIRKARNDSPLFQKESYLRIWNALRSRFVRRTSIPA